MHTWTNAFEDGRINFTEACSMLHEGYVYIITRYSELYTYYCIFEFTKSQNRVWVVFSQHAYDISNIRFVNKYDFLDMELIIFCVFSYYGQMKCRCSMHVCNGSPRSFEASSKHRIFWNRLEFHATAKETAEHVGSFAMAHIAQAGSMYWLIIKKFWKLKICRAIFLKKAF